MKVKKAVDKKKKKAPKSVEEKEKDDSMEEAKHVIED